MNKGAPESPAIELDWQPIATAPMDGTRVLLFDQYFNTISVAYYRTWEFLDWEEIDETTKTKTKICKGAEWCRWNQTYGTFWFPTHWAKFVDIFPVEIDPPKPKRQQHRVMVRSKGR